MVRAQWRQCLNQSTMDPNQAAHLLAFMGPVFLVFIAVAWAIVIVPMWQIFKKAGFTPALSLLMIIPLVNLIMLYVLAFSRWKVVPAPEYGGGYPPAGYVPPQTGYTAPGAYAPQQSVPAYPPAYPPNNAPAVPPNDPPNSI